ncbi:MAG: acetate--CoA ligase family protein [Dehalococcoidia bacterium]
MSTLTQVTEQARSEGRTVLTEIESKQVLAAAGIPVAEARLATTPDEAVKVAGSVGYPVVMKIVSPEITHKSDVGGVKVNVKTADEVRAAFEEITAAARAAQAGAKIAGVAVQKMAPQGIEVIIGMSKDPQFGPVLMFGLGGVLVEVLKDVSFRIVPIERRDARQMIEEIQAFPVLQGVRGQDPADIGALEDLLLKLSEFVEANPQVAELDLNPVFAYKDRALAVDARIVVGGVA